MHVRKKTSNIFKVLKEKKKVNKESYIYQSYLLEMEAKYRLSHINKQKEFVDSRLTLQKILKIKLFRLKASDSNLNSHEKQGLW